MTHKTASVETRLEKLGFSGPQAPLLGYVACFNAAQFYEAHDVLEDLWLAEGPLAVDHGFHKGLIQFTGAFVHLQKGRWGPAIRLFELSESYLRHYPVRYQDMDLVSVKLLGQEWKVVASEMDRSAGSGKSACLAFPKLEFPPIHQFGNRERLGVVAWRQWGAQRFCSGQPTARQITGLAKSGIRSVINLAQSDSTGALADEAQWWRTEGVEYSHLPVSFENPTHRDFENFSAWMSHQTGDILVHCAMNYRASMFCAAYACVVEGMPTDAGFQKIRKVWHPDSVWTRWWSETVMK